MLKVNKIDTHYGTHHVLRGVSLDVGDGDFVTVVGANGAGKTTLLRTISGFVTPTQGDIEYDGKRLNRVKTAEIVKMGICQVPEGKQLFPAMTVRENLEMGAYLRKDKRVAKDIERVHELFPILKKRAKQLAGTLSGGEQQMLAFARGLMSDPKLLLLDEPSLGLSPILVETIMEAITRINSQKIAILLVEQNANIALQLAGRGYVLELGNVVLKGSGEELLNNEEVRKSYLGM